jgi:pantoate--beta-alanine ligase
MQNITSIAELREVVLQWRESGERIALVPTMGNLHEGHLRLVEEAHANAERIIVSVFVNPMQFTDSSAGAGDYKEYPRTLDADIEKLSAMTIGVDMLFTPSVEEVYPNGIENETRVVVPKMSDILCGEFRPGHFVGVATILAKLFNMTQPNVAVFGEKDYQQLLVIRRLVTDLCFPIDIIGVPTVREADRLAMSSRNQYLTKEERKVAATLNKTLLQAKHSIKNGATDFPGLEKNAMKQLQAAGFRPEYFSIRRVDDLQPAQVDDPSLVILVAAWLGEARLIDNVRV